MGVVSSVTLIRAIFFLSFSPYRKTYDSPSSVNGVELRPRDVSIHVHYLIVACLPIESYSLLVPFSVVVM